VLQTINFIILLL